MPDTNKKQHHRKLKMVSKTCYGANIIYLCVHVLYLILFLIAQMHVVAIIDAAVIVIYVLLFLLIKKEKYYIYALVCGNLFFAFICTNSVLLGFDTGFYFYLIGLCVVSFFTTYFSKARNIKGSIIWAGLSLIIYLVLYLITSFNEPRYVPEKWLKMTLFIIHSASAFAFIAIYMCIFLKYAFSLENKIMSQSRTDELTQIANRYALYDHFDEDDNKNSKILALFDIDDFKNINDTYGHVNGDIILRRVAEIATETMKDCFVCRYGGEEFVLVFKDEPDNPSLERLETLRKSIEKEQFEFEDTKIHVTITIGASSYIKDLSLEKWVELADKKMYFGKNSGKNKTVI